MLSFSLYPPITSVEVPILKIIHGQAVQGLVLRISTPLCVESTKSNNCGLVHSATFWLCLSCGRHATQAYSQWDRLACMCWVPSRSFFETTLPGAENIPLRCLHRIFWLIDFISAFSNRRTYTHEPHSAFKRPMEHRIDFFDLVFLYRIPLVCPRFCLKNERRSLERFELFVG
jgi:hypothetical protein